MPTKNTWVNAAIGAVITIGLSFTGVAPLLGGGVAGYLQRETPKRGAKVGALSGAIATIPIVLVMCLGLVLFVGVPTASSVPGGLELAIIFLLMLPMLALWFVGLSAAGGYLGGSIATDSQPPTGNNSTVEQ